MVTKNIRFIIHINNINHDFKGKLNFSSSCEVSEHFKEIYSIRPDLNFTNKIKPNATSSQNQNLQRNVYTSGSQRWKRGGTPKTILSILTAHHSTIQLFCLFQTSNLLCLNFFSCFWTLLKVIRLNLIYFMKFVYSIMIWNKIRKVWRPTGCEILI